MSPSPAQPYLAHEVPLYAVLPRSVSIATALARALAHADVRQFVLPPLWFLERSGVDLPAALPGVRTITPGTLERVLEEAAALCTPARLEALTLRAWREAEESVRQHFLQRGTLRVLAGIFRLGPKSIELPPTPEFRADRVHENRFEATYRLAPSADARDHPAPAEEGSVVAYPFDPDNHLARRELGLPEGTGPILEVFAYAWEHDRHRALWTALARDLGARVIAPGESA